MWVRGGHAHIHTISTIKSPSLMCTLNSFKIQSPARIFSFILLMFFKKDKKKFTNISCIASILWHIFYDNNRNDAYLLNKILLLKYTRIDRNASILPPQKRLKPMQNGYYIFKIDWLSLWMNENEIKLMFLLQTFVLCLNFIIVVHNRNVKQNDGGCTILLQNHFPASLLN